MGKLILFCLKDPPARKSTLLDAMKSFCLIGAILVLAFAPLFGWTEDSATTSKIISSTENLQIFNIGGFLEDKRLKLSDQLVPAVRSLGQGPTYDLREMLEYEGVRIGEEGLALYSPETRLIYVRSSPDIVKMVEMLFQNRCCNAIGYAVEFSIVSRPNGGEQSKSLARLKFVTVSGVPAEISNDGRSFKIQLITWPDDEGVDAKMSGTLPIGEKEIALNMEVSFQMGENTTLFETESTKDDETGGLRVTLLVEPRYDEKTLQRTDEWRREKLKKVEEELRAR